MEGPEVCNWNNCDEYMHGPEVCNWNNFDGYMHGPEVCNWNNFDGYMDGSEVCNLNNFDEYMDRREVCNSMNELEKSVESAVVSSPRSQQEVSDEDRPRILHKVPYILRQVNEKAYVPRVISIGPYHHGKEHLKPMEDVKRSYFSRMIEATTMTEEIFVDAMMMEVEGIRKRYEGPLDHIKSEAFAKMLVFDGCFILQLLEEGFGSQIEVIHQVNIGYDLLLLENQLPFSVLLKLYDMMRGDGQQEKLHHRACCFFNGWVLGKNISRGDKKPYHDYHLLGLVYDSWLSSQKKDEDECKIEVPENICTKKKEVNLKMEATSKAPDVVGSRKFISCATDLARAGINFKKKCEWNTRLSDIDLCERNTRLSDIDLCERNTRLLDIDFARDAKELNIPKLRVDDSTEVILRNMMAYEQFIISKDRPTLVCDYVTFMDNLIDSGEDVQILRDADVIENWLGDDKAVAKMFNKLRDDKAVAKTFSLREDI